MESLSSVCENPSERVLSRQSFLHQCGLAHLPLFPLTADCSRRSYYRIIKGRYRFILMDAPPAHEDVRPFCYVEELLRDREISAPTILEADIEQGWLLLEDFGTATYTQCLIEESKVSEKVLFNTAVQVLERLHNTPQPTILPCYSLAHVEREVGLFVDYYWPWYSGKTLSERERNEFISLWSPIWKMLENFPKIMALCDYHVDNLIWLPKRKGMQRCGVLDFQDAVMAPVGFDLMSLCEDERRDMSESLTATLRARYLKECHNMDAETLDTAWALLGAIRHCKNLGVFTRMATVYQNASYLKHLPRMWQWLNGNLRHPYLQDLRDWLTLRFNNISP